MKVSPISRVVLDQWVLEGTVVERDVHGVKVVRLPDGLFLKYFRRKRFFNRELLAPAAVRFARHAHQLNQADIPTLTVLRLHRVIGEPHTVAVYRPLPGTSLRQLLADGAVGPHQMYRIGVFLARLHRLGIYFRALHPGNIVVDNDRPGLIDVLDMRIRPWSLTRWERRRNWWHFLRCEEDRPYLKGELVDELLAGYRDAADVPAREFHREARVVRHNLGWKEPA